MIREFILNDEFLYWFIGFTEGDGSFVKSSRNILNFNIVQVKANVEILYKIQKYLGFGQVLKQNERVYRYIVQNAPPMNSLPSDQPHLMNSLSSE